MRELGKIIGAIGVGLGVALIKGVGDITGLGVETGVGVGDGKLFVTTMVLGEGVGVGV